MACNDSTVAAASRGNKLARLFASCKFDAYCAAECEWSTRERFVGSGEQESNERGRFLAHSTVTVSTRPGNDRMIASQVRVAVLPSLLVSKFSYIAIRTRSRPAVCVRALAWTDTGH
jgi:hypothetical protein